MNNLLILPANRAIRQNPQDPSGFPSFDQQALLPGVTEALDYYKQQGYTIAVCENAAAVEKGITPLMEKLSEMIVLMTALAPQIDQLLFCSDYAGAYAYRLVKQASDTLPLVQRLRSAKGLQGQTTAPPDDSESSVCWQDLAVPSFRKPGIGMCEVLINQLQPLHIVGVWEREEDYTAVQALRDKYGTVVVQSATFWRDKLDPTAMDRAKPIAQAKAKPTPAPRPTPTAATDPRTQWLKLTYVNRQANADKFWAIRLTDDLLGFIVQHGRNGTAGRVLPPKLFATQQQAGREYDKIIAEKRYAGYH